MSARLDERVGALTNRLAQVADWTRHDPYAEPQPAELDAARVLTRQALEHVFDESVRSDGVQLDLAFVLGAIERANASPPMANLYVTDPANARAGRTIRR